MSELAETKSGLIRACGTNLRYELAGQGPALVLIHMGLADSRLYDPQFGVFARHCRVLRYDLPGFGLSSWPSQAYTQHEVLRELLDQLGIERATLLGASLGGAIALDFALSYPERVQALIAVGSGISGYPQTPDDAQLFAPVMEAFNTDNVTRAIDLMIHIWVDGPGRSPDAVAASVRERVRTLYTDVLLRTREGGRQPDPLDPPAYGRLQEISAPTLVIVGAEDVQSIRDQADLIASSISGARKEVLSGVAHVPSLEVPEAFNQLVLGFLREHQLAS